MRTRIRHWRCPVGILVAGLHAAMVVASIAEKNPLPARRSGPQASTAEGIYFDPWTVAGVVVVANRPFHYEYEPTVVKALLIVDTPSLLITSLLADTITKTLAPSRKAISYLNAAGWLCFGSLEWWGIGAFLSRRWQNRRS
jgi:hypothetical protein